MALHTNENGGNKKSVKEDISRDQPTQRPRMPQRNDLRAMSRSSLGEVLTQFQRAMQQHIDEVDNQNMEMSVLPLDGPTHGMYYSSAIVCGVLNINGQKVVSAYTMILEGSNLAPRPQTSNIYGRQVTIHITPMDAWDQETYNKVLSVVSAKYGESARILNANACVVPESFDLSDKSKTWELLWSAQEAIIAGFQSSYPDLMPSFQIGEHIDTKKNRVVAQFAYNATDGESVTGFPVRSDITVSISKVSHQQHKDWANVSSFQHQSTANIGEVNSFVDLVYAPSQQQPVYGQPPITQIFRPRITITRIATYDTTPFSPETFFLGLATAMMLGDNYAWASQFANYAKEEFHDIGAIGLRMRSPADMNATIGRIDTKTNTFGQNELFDLIQTACYSHPVFSLDCEDVGPDSWLTSAFVESAHGKPESTRYLIDALDNLTGGIFSNLFDASQPIVVSESNRIHLGTYVDNKGVHRDIREIDSLAVLSMLGEQDMNAVNMWESTFSDTSVPMDLRLETRKGILDNLAGTAKIIGYAERVTFTSHFTKALVAAVAQAGLSVDQDGLRTMFGNNYQVGNTFINQYASDVSAAGLMNTNQTSYGNHQFRRPMSKW